MLIFTAQFLSCSVAMQMRWRV